METNWDRSSWRRKTRRQMPDYLDAKELRSAEKNLNNLPPLVFAGEVRNLNMNWLELRPERHFYFRVEIVQRVLRNFLPT